MTSHYDTLGVPSDANQDDIKRAFRKKSSQHHPDRPGGSTEAMAKVNEAYAVLSDPQRRLGYDQTGRDPAQGPTLDDIAEQALSELIQQMLADEAKGDLVKLLDKHISRSIEQIKGRIKANERTIARLSKQLNRVVRKSAGRVSLFNAVLEKKIKQAESEVEESGHLLEISTRALEILNDHDDTKPDVAPAQPPKSRHDAIMDELMNGSQFGGRFGGPSFFR